jgi:hypothetical protein
MAGRLSYIMCLLLLFGVNIGCTLEISAKVTESTKIISADTVVARTHSNITVVCSVDEAVASNLTISPEWNHILTQDETSVLITFLEVDRSLNGSDISCSLNGVHSNSIHLLVGGKAGYFNMFTV